MWKQTIQKSLAVVPPHVVKTNEDFLLNSKSVNIFPDLIMAEITDWSCVNENVWEVLIWNNYESEW